MNALLQQAAQRFPLIARPRPACLPLRTRIAELRDLGDAAAQGTSADHLTLASETLNKAALIASDCGDSAMARSLCWRHFDAYRPAWPLAAPQARSVLEPLVNLARLAIREHDGHRGYHLLNALFYAVATRSEADTDGCRISFDTFTRSSDDLQTVRTWLWGVFLTEGIRALISAGRWHRAVAHAEKYRGVGQRLLDGRQAAIVAHCLAGHTDTALALVADSAPAQPWEQAIADCLGALCSQAAGRSTGDTLTRVQRLYFDLDRTPGLQVFNTRLGLTIIDLASNTDQATAERTHTFLISETLATADGYAARDVLAYDGCKAKLTESEKRALTSAVQSAGLGLGAIPALLMDHLLSAVKTSETVIKRSLDVRVPK